MEHVRNKEVGECALSPAQAGQPQPSPAQLSRWVRAHTPCGADASQLTAPPPPPFLVSLLLSLSPAAPLLLSLALPLPPASTPLLTVPGLAPATCCRVPCFELTQACMKSIYVSVTSDSRSCSDYMKSLRQHSSNRCVWGGEAEE